MFIELNRGRTSGKIRINAQEIVAIGQVMQLSDSNEWIVFSGSEVFTKNCSTFWVTESVEEVEKLVENAMNNSCR